MATSMVGGVNDQAIAVQQPDPSQSSKFEGFDFLRAIFALVVVVLHANVLIALTGRLQLGWLADILKANIGYLAVPIFFQISLFLFFIKSEKSGSHYFWHKRLPKLVSLYLFWAITKLIFDFLLEGKSEAIKYGSSSLGKMIGFLISGGYSAFYFFFSLIFLTAITEFSVQQFRTLNRTSVRQINYWLLLLSCMMIFAFPFIDSQISDQEALTQIFIPLNFLPYVFTVAITLQEFQAASLQTLTPKLTLKLSCLFASFLFFTILEWVLFHRFPQYSRVSLVFGSWLLLYLALLSRQKVPIILRFLSGCSLGIYGFHVFFVDHTPFLEKLSIFVPGLGPLSRFAIAVAGSIVLTLLFRRIKFLKGFV